MGSRRFEITIVSAENLPDIRRLGRMKPYAVVSLDGSMETTNVDRGGETSPMWNFPFVYNIDEAHLHRAGLDVVVDIFSERSIGGDKLIGRVVIPVKHLFEKGLESEISFPIAGTACGRLYIRYCFEHKNLGPKMLQVEAWGRRHEMIMTRPNYDHFNFKGSDNYIYQ